MTRSAAILLGCLALAPGAHAEGRPLRLLTFNLLHGGLGFAYRGDAQRLEERLAIVTRELRRLDADVIGLQEASYSWRHGDVAARLARELGYHHVRAAATSRFGPFVFAALGMDEGPAILSRFPIMDSDVTRVDGCGGLYRRVLVCARIDAPGGPLDACSAHIDGSDCQADRVAALLRGRPAAEPLVLMGDLNATLDSPGIRRLIADLGFVDTYHVVNPRARGATVWQPVDVADRLARRRVDFVLVASGRGIPLHVVDSRIVLHEPEQAPDGSVLWPSDHHGVLSVVELDRTGARAGERAGP